MHTVGRNIDMREKAIERFAIHSRGTEVLWARVKAESSPQALYEFRYKCLGEFGYPNQKPLPEYRVGYTQAQRQFVRAILPHKRFK